MMKPSRVDAVGLVGLLLVGAGVCGMLARPSGEADRTLANRFGDVVWNHGLHARLAGVACRNCHHADGAPGAVRPKPCRDCHQLPPSSEAPILAGPFGGGTEPTDPTQPRPAMAAFHDVCKGCHAAKRQGPTACRDCHAQRFSESHGEVAWSHLNHSRRMDELSCQDCHHLDNNASWDGEYHSCRDCHDSALARADADADAGRAAQVLFTGVPMHEDVRHGECAFCHVVDNPEDRASSCSACHPGMDRAEDESGPRSLTLEQAVHQKCRECHRLDRPELEPGMPARCGDCHRPSASALAGWKQGGDVLWSHRRHLPRYNNHEWTCETCHHADIPGQPRLACASCHPAKRADLNYSLPPDRMPLLADAYQKTCVGCHREKKAGPTRFEGFTVAKIPGLIASQVGADVVWWDHRRHADAMGFSCRECHHNTRTRDGALIICPSAVSCPENRGVGVAQACKHCHGEAGPVHGGPAEGIGDKAPPPLAEAFKRPCLACHQQLGGPARWEDLYRQPEGPR